MAWLLVSAMLMVQAFESAQPLAPGIWAIATVQNVTTSPVISGVTYSNPFGYPDLYSTTSFIHSAVHDYSVGLQWQYFGIPEYREDTVSVGAGWAIAQWINLGVELHDYILSIHTEKFTRTQNFYDYGVYCIIKPFDPIQFFIMQNNIMHFHDDGYIPSESMLQTRAEIFKGCIIEYELHYSDYIWQIFRINGYITHYCAVDIAYSRELHLSSAGVTILWDSLLLRYELQHHTFLGNTHRFGLVYSYNPLTYALSGKPVKKETLKLDIQTCTAEELMALDIVPEVLCQRVVKYRAMFGPVSITSLYQLGFTTQQVRDLQQYAYNFYEQGKDVHTDSKENKKALQKNYISSEEKNKKIKQLFQSMIAAEIPAYTALSLAEEYQKSGAKGVLQSPVFKSLPIHQQKVVKTACGIQ